MIKQLIRFQPSGLFKFCSIYKPQTPLSFPPSNECLIYLYIPRITTPAFLYMPHIIPFIFTTKLILNNPFFLTFPAALPLLMMLECMNIEKA